jgi:MFS superfamily sulfate permease-like transporter
MVTRIFPFLSWVKGYRLDSLRADALAGLTVALVLIPQSMAYAQLAGLPSYYGLYAAFLPPMIAALFGSSRQLATGPVAVVSLMTAASLAPLATTGSDTYIAYAILLALVVGAFQLLLGVLRLGLVVNFLSHPVVNGFTNAAAIIIATSQLSKMFGVDVDTADHHYQTIVRVVEAASHFTHWPTFFMGVLAFAIMYGLKRLAPKVPNVLVAVVITTVLAAAYGLEHNLRVDLARMNSPQVQDLIRQFNRVTGEITLQGQKRTELSRAIEEAKKNHNRLGLLHAEHAQNILTMNVEEQKLQAQILRQKIRKLILERVVQADGSSAFYLKEGRPPGLQGDGRVWRIRAGNKPIPEDKILVMGGGAVVGVVPEGLPSFSLPQIELSVFLHLLPFAAIISLLGFMEAISIAKAMAGKTGQRLDPNQELIGQGLANLVGAVGKSYPVSGSFSRSAVNLQAGALTGLSSAFTSVAVVIVLLFFTPLLYHLPQSVLAAVIMMAVIGLINISGFIHAWKAQWYDGLISILTFLGTLAFAPHLDKGIMVGVVLSLLVFLYKSMRPKLAALSRHEDQSLRCADTHSLKECEYLALIRFEGPLFFANSSYLEDKIMDLMRKKKRLKHLVLVANGINDIDASGEETLSLLVDRIRSAGLDISLSGVNETVWKVLKRTHFPEKIGEDHFYPTMEQAISAIVPQTHHGEQEENCPLLAVCHL